MWNYWIISDKIEMFDGHITKTIKGEIMKSIISNEELKYSSCETGSIKPDKVMDFDVIVVGAGASGVSGGAAAARRR